MKKHIITLVVLISCSFALEAQTDTLWKMPVWPNCNGYGTISKACYEDYKETGYTPDQSISMPPGEYPLQGEMVYYSAEELEWGFCAARQIKLGLPFDPTDLCNTKVGKKIGRFVLGTGCSDSIPTFILHDSYLEVQVCGEVYKEFFPCQEVITEYELMCTGDTLSWYGRSLTTAGTHTFRVFNEEGCDTLRILNLDILPAIQTSLSETLVEGDSTSFAGEIIKTAGTYTDTLQSKSGCDSIVSLTLTVRQPQPDKCEECKEWYSSLGPFEARGYAGWGSQPHPSELEHVREQGFIYGFDLGYWKGINFLSGPCSQSEIGGRVGLNVQQKSFADPSNCDCFNYDESSDISFYVEPMYRWSYTGWCDQTLIPSIGIGARALYNNHGHEDIGRWSVVPTTSFNLRKYFSSSRSVSVADIDNPRRTVQQTRRNVAFVGVQTQVFHDSFRRPSWFIGVELGIRFGGRKQNKTKETDDSLQLDFDDDESNELTF